MTRAAIIQDGHRLSSPYEINFYEVRPRRQHVQTFVLIDPTSAPWTFVRGREKLRYRHHIICACFPYLQIRLAHLCRQGNPYSQHRGRGGRRLERGASLWRPNDGEVRAPKKRSLLWLADIHTLLDSDVIAWTELWCQSELQRGNQPIMHPWPQCRMFQIGIHTRKRTGHRHPPLGLLPSIALWLRHG